MADNKHGTADVTLSAWLLADLGGGRSGAAEVVRRFAWLARLRGTVVVQEVSWRVESAPDVGEPPVHVASLRFRHTCRNRGNHEHDARRFLERALRVGRDDEWAGEVTDVTLNSWEAVEPSPN